MTLRMAACAACVLIAAAAHAVPSVLNVVASQRNDGTGLVDVYYALSGAASPTIVSLTFSNDNGANWNVLPAPSRLSGDVGPGVTNGTNKHIVWDAPRDRANVYWPNAKARVTASEIDGETLTVTLTGGVPLELVRIPADSFSMGSAYDPPYSSTNEWPVHTVNINYDFYMCRYEITQAQWYAVMGGFPGTQSGGANPDFPVVNVSWNDAQSFITKLNLLGVGNFRLPSESEWEYACRAGTGTRWYHGDNETQLGDYAWYSANYVSGSYAKVVGQKLPNAFGLFDMHGNVWEWVEDWWHDTYDGAPTDGSAWVEPAGTYRVLRGGAFGYSASNCRSALRHYISPGFRSSPYGVRLVRTF